MKTGENLERLKQYADAHKALWQQSVYDLTRMRLQVRNNRDTFRNALAEYRKEKVKVAGKTKG